MRKKCYIDSICLLIYVLNQYSLVLLSAHLPSYCANLVSGCPKLFPTCHEILKLAHLPVNSTLDSSV